METHVRTFLRLTAGCLCLPTVAFAADVVIHPGNGVETNVAAIASASAVRINPGASGGGIVRLDAGCSYSAPTTLGCGTLVAGSVAPTGQPSGLGASGTVSIGAGTFRYVGPDGGWTDRPFTNDTPVTNQAAVYDIRRDLTLACDLVQARGSFVKIGPGTLRLAGTGTTRLNQAGVLRDSAEGFQCRFVPNANGDSPVTGYRGFHVLEGTLVLGERGGTYRIGNANNAGIGGWTTERTQEVDATVEVVGGDVQFAGWFMHGSYNGHTNNTPVRLPRATFRVRGGRVTMGDCFSMGRNKLGYAAFPQRSAPRLEVYGGTMTIANDLNMADDRGAYTVVEVTNGTLSASMAQTGRIGGNADTTNSVRVTGSGRLVLAGAFTNRRDIVTHVTVSDGGYLSLVRLVNGAGRVTVDVSDGGTLAVDEIECLCGTVACRFDGATVRARSAGRHVLLPDDPAVTAEIGPGGLVLESAARGASVLAGSLSSSGDIVLRGEATATNVFAAAQAYAGPTRLESGVLAFEGAGALPALTDLAVAGGALLVTNRTQVVRMLALDAAPIGLHVVAGFTPLVARTGFTASDEASLSIRMDGIAVCGTYPVLDVPAANRTALAQLAARSALSAVLPANMTAALGVATSNGLAVLVVRAESTVRQVVPQGGTETFASLAFATAPERLVVGPGTLRYTGTGEDVGGITLDAGTQKCAILEITRDLAPRTVRTGASALMKTGPGDLILVGDGPFELGNTKKNKDLMLGIGADGSSPLDAFQHVTVADGRLVIGTPGGGVGSPYIDLSGRELHVGGVTASVANGRTETSGEIVLESGTVDCAIFTCGYYNGSGGQGPAGGTHPTLTVNGGLLRAGTFTLGYDLNVQRHVAHARVNMSGGRIETGAVAFQSSPGDTNSPPTSTWTQSGGDFACTSFTIGSRAVTDGAYGPARLTISGGTFAVLDAMKMQYGTDTTVEIGEDATFTCGAISGAGAASSVLRFDGGTWRGYAAADGPVAVSGLTHLYLGRRTTLDLTALSPGAWMRLDQKMEGESDDAGLTVAGNGAVSFGPAFAESVLAGPTCISNGVTLWQEGSGGTVSNLLLGADGAAGCVTLDVDASTGAGFTVLGTLDIRAPVTVRAHAGTSPLAREVVSGTYTALVYRATQTVDLSRFVAPKDAHIASVTYEEVALEGGWKAVVATIAAQEAGAYSMGVRAWSATTSGGKWHSQANWTGWAPPDGAGAVAGFRPATTAAVPVTLERTATVGALALSGAASTGYRLIGETLALDAEDSLPEVSAVSGTHELSLPISTGSDMQINTRAGAALTLGGDIAGTNRSVLVNRDAATGGGTVVFGGALDGIRQVSVGCGRTVLSNLSFAATADALQLGGGTLRYEGPDADIAEIALANGGGRAAVLDVPFGRTVSARSMTASGTAFIKAGAGDLKLAGGGAFTLGAAASNRTNQANTYIRANGDSPVSTYRRGNVSQGRIVQGTVGDPSDAPVVTCSDFCVGVDSVEGEDCEYVMNNGILNASSFYVDYYHGVTRRCQGRFTLNGGAVTSSWVRLGQTGSGPMYARPAVVVNGGFWRVSGPFTLGYQKASPGATDCSVTMNGGELDIGGTLLLGRAGSNTGTVYLCGGVLRAENIVRSNGTARVHFDGGVFAPYCASEANRTMQGLTAAYVGEGGAVIDLARAGGTYAVMQSLLHDPACDGADGGLRVTGGTLVLGGANTYTGPTVLEGSTIDLNGTTKTLTRLEGRGRMQNGKVTVTDVLRPGGSGTVGLLHLDADAVVMGAVEVELGDRIDSMGTVDVTGATLLVTDLNRLQRWNSHLLIDTAGGVRGTFAESNLDGSGYRVLNTGKSLYLWNGAMSAGTTIFVR